MKYTTIIALSAALALLLGGCGNNTKEAKVVDEVPALKHVETSKASISAPKSKVADKVVSNTKATEVKAPTAPATVVQAPKDANAPILSKFYKIFSDGAQIAPKNGKPLLLVFGQPADSYTQKLQADVTQNSTLAKKITDTMTPVYINAAAQKRHKFLHNGDMMDVDTKTLISIYHLDATPTLIFMDDKSQSIFIVPGYMPPKQFEVTLQFVKDGVWRGKDRKNGEVYQALKEYYEAHGVQVSKAKK